MHIWETDLSHAPLLTTPLTICLGYFDGLHVGHQALIRYAKALGHPTALLTFDRNPKPGRETLSLTPLKTKKRMLASLGIDYLIVVQFTEKVKHMDPNTFIDYLKQLGGTDLVCGPDFRFGHQARGDVNLLNQVPNWKVHLFPHVLIGAEKVSTSQILTILNSSNILNVVPLLGRPYAVEGYVGKGLGEGRKMGYPTANIVLDAPYYLPRNGVYITLIKFDGQTYYSLASLGFHPTVAQLDHPTLEVFVLNYQGNLYEKSVAVAFLHYLRPEQKFQSKMDLIAQMDRDKTEALRLQSSLPNDF
jgi:riboflavin kinase / FMN adenylyltransferase